MKNVLVFEPKDFSQKVIEKLEKNQFKVVLNNNNTISIEKALETFEIIYLRLGVKIDLPLLSRCKNIKCRFFLVPATGIDHIDEQACAKYQIKVVSFKYNKELLKDIRATAELTVGLTISLLRNIVLAANNTKEGYWNRDLFRGKDIFGKNVGIIGFGRLGRIVSDYFHTFGAHVMVYEKGRVVLPNYLSKADNIEDIFKYNDIVSLHIDYRLSNINLIDKNCFGVAERKPIFINTSRGQLVNEQDLLDALRSGTLSGAALDVINDEFGFSNDNPLVSYANLNDNLIITPHIGGCTIDSSHKTEEIITEEFFAQIKI